ncbi:unnamed protein product [Dibothriocephalus latus]|uniref:Uncharacterized protein n=1 Tax=Dibothriocephalus latus TaxID=60516 RepID=A0A3P7MHI1_DIBLA|nr:unnamed protein product [Dibothriocephalus latus]
MAAEDDSSVEVIEDGPVLSVGSAADLRQKLQLPKCLDVSVIIFQYACGSMAILLYPEISAQQVLKRTICYYAEFTFTMTRCKL